jgi:hypothetical protein
VAVGKGVLVEVGGATRLGVAGVGEPQVVGLGVDFDLLRLLSP